MTETFDLNRCVFGDCLATLVDVPAQTFHCCVTSPPYWGLRDYGHADQFGLEATPEIYVQKLVRFMREVGRTLRDDGTLWLNLGDSYASNSGSAGLKAKDLVGIPWRAAFALQTDGWYLRSEIIWHKANPMPESVKDRPSKAHEQVFLLSKSERYFYDADAIKEAGTSLRAGNTEGNKHESAYHAGDKRLRTRANLSQIEAKDFRNARDVWTMPSEPYAGAHFATMPRTLAKRCILAGSPAGGAVLDPFLGSGTVAEQAELLGRRWFGCELNPDYKTLIDKRTAQTGFVFDDEVVNG